MTKGAFLHSVRQQAVAHEGEFAEALKWMSEPDNIEDHANEIGVSTEHPYWRNDPEERAQVLRICDGLIELLKAMYPPEKV